MRLRENVISICKYFHHLLKIGNIVFEYAFGFRIDCGCFSSKGNWSFNEIDRKFYDEVFRCFYELDKDYKLKSKISGGAK